MAVLEKLKADISAVKTSLFALIQNSENHHEMKKYAMNYCCLGGDLDNDNKAFRDLLSRYENYKARENALESIVDLDLRQFLKQFKGQLLLVFKAEPDSEEFCQAACKFIEIFSQVSWFCESVPNFKLPDLDTSTCLGELFSLGVKIINEPGQTPFPLTTRSFGQMGAHISALSNTLKSVLADNLKESILVMLSEHNTAGPGYSEATEHFFENVGKFVMLHPNMEQIKLKDIRSEMTETFMFYPESPVAKCLSGFMRTGSKVNENIDGSNPDYFFEEVIDEEELSETESRFTEEFFKHVEEIKPKLTEVCWRVNLATVKIYFEMWMTNKLELSGSMLEDINMFFDQCAIPVKELTDHKKEIEKYLSELKELQKHFRYEKKNDVGVIDVKTGVRCANKEECDVKCEMMEEYKHKINRKITKESLSIVYFFYY